MPDESVQMLLRQLASLEQRTADLEARLEQLQALEDSVYSTALAERGLFAELVDHSNANVHVIDSGFHWLAINRQAREDFHFLYGRTPQVGDYMPELMLENPTDSQVILPLWQRALAGERFVAVNTFGVGAGQRHYELRFNTLRGPAGELQGAYLFAYDISERVEEQQRAEHALRQAQKMEAVGQLSSGIAHDFNNLLGGIIGAQELMAQRVQQGRYAELVPLLISAQGSAQSASALVHRLLAFSRKQALQPQATAVAELIKGMEELIRRSIGPAIMLRSYLDSDLWLAFIDPPQLESALLNLCINARDALPDGGQIDIRARNVQLDEQHAQMLELQAGPYLVLSVEDNGCGMSAEVAQRAIDPFFTTKPPGQGSGMGLSMVYGFVRQSYGQLHIQSTPGRGTGIHLYLPRHIEVPSPARLPAQAAVARAPCPGQRSIILVEDQIALHTVIGEVLEDLGHRLHAFKTGDAAVKALQEGLRADLLISDIGLPGKADGHRVAEIFASHNPLAPVLLITGHDPQNALRSSCASQIMFKPFALETLAERIGRLLESACSPAVSSGPSKP